MTAVKHKYGLVLQGLRSIKCTKGLGLIAVGGGYSNFSLYESLKLELIVVP